MTLPTQLLVVIDPTEDAQPALAHAAALARKTRARLELFICAYDSQLLEAHGDHMGRLSKARDALVAGHVHRLRLHAAPLLAEGLSVTVDSRWDSPLHDGIVRKAIDSQADMVVKDTHYHAALKRSIFSNTDWQLIRECPVPLWLVKPRVIPANPRFVAAVDPLHELDKPADLDHTIMTTASELAAAFGGELHVYHAFDIVSKFVVSTSIPPSVVLPAAEVIQALRDQHTAVVRGLAEDHGVPRDRVHIHQGGTRAGLLDLTERLAADVVVMGAVSRRGLSRVFLGNTAEDVLDKLGCDLLIVKTPALAAKLRG